MKTSSAFRRYRELILGAMMLAFGSVYFYHSLFIKVRSTVKVSAKLIPEILGIMAIILGVMQIARGFIYLTKAREADTAEGRTPVLIAAEERRDIGPIAFTFVLIIAYAVAFEPLGFVIASTVCMFLQMLILAPRGERRPLVFFLIALAVACVAYVTFRKGLHLTLPPGPLVGLPI